MASTSITLQTRPDMLTALKSLGLTPVQVKHAHKRALTALGAWSVRQMRDAVKPGSGQGQPGGDKWVELSPEWVAQKASEGRKTHIGVYKGRMQNSFSFDASSTQVEMGPTVEHAESFDAHRPITPKEEYALSRMQLLLVDAYDKEAR